MSDIALQLEYSVEVDVSPEFAWQNRTDISKWSDPPARFTLDGPFGEGVTGTTEVPGQPTFHWRIRDVRQGEAFVVEMQLDRATLSFEWLLGRVSQHRTRLTQRIVLAGENAAAYAPQVEAGFGSTLADGMKRVAAEMVVAGKDHPPAVRQALTN